MKLLAAILFAVPSFVSAKVTLPISAAERVVMKTPLLHRLIRAGQIKNVMLLLPTLEELKAGINDLDAMGDNPLHLAVQKEDIELAEILILYEADPNMENDNEVSPVHEAARLGNVEMLNLLLRNGGDPKLEGRQLGLNALHWGAVSGDVDTLKLLLKHVDINKTNAQGANAASTALWYADDDNLTGLQFLFKQGLVPDFNYLPKDKKVPKLTKLMIALGADVNASDGNGITPLMKVMRSGDIESGKILVQAGAKVTTEDHHGNSALTHAMSNRERAKEAVEFLFEQNIDVKTTSGRVAFFMAVSTGNYKLAELLLKQVTAGDMEKNPVPDEWHYLDGITMMGPGNQPTNASGSVFNLVPSNEMMELLISYGFTPARQEQNKLPKSRDKVPDFLTDLNRLAYEGKISPVTGRSEEIENVIISLGRKLKNNPLLVGEAGVGKTAIVEGLAHMIAHKQLPEGAEQILEGKTIYSLDMGQLMSGTKYRGEFEDKIKDLLRFITEESDGKAILFIDEIHQIMGAGSSNNSNNDAAGLLKPALARGELSCIGATTYEEYQRHILNDSALERRFLPISVEEPSVEETVEILTAIKKDYEEDKGIEISTAAVRAAAELAEQYITDRNFPDKAIDLLDDAATKLKLKPKADKPKPPLGREHIAIAIARKYKIPIARIMQSKQERIKAELLPYLQKRIIGQDHVLQEIREKLLDAYGESNPNQPIAAFLFAGPTGTGKTETAKVLAEFLFGSERGIIRFDMSEYKEKHTMQNLSGSPTGYVGYEDGGILTAKVRAKPYSLLLFDEVDKAHPDFYDILLQILSDGRLTDNKGRTVSFKNTIIILTTNSGSDIEVIEKDLIGYGDREQIKAGNEILRQILKPEIRGRLGEDGMLTFKRLEPATMAKLVAKQLTEFNAELQKKGVTLSLTDEAVSTLIERGYDPELGARPLLDIFRKLISRPVSRRLTAGAGEMEEGSYVVDIAGEETIITADN